MREIERSELGGVHGGESLGDVLHAYSNTPDVAIDQTKQATIDFINQHPFFHRGVMDRSIGFGKHFRNVPFIGPGRIAKGVWNGDGDEIRRGVQVTKGTWAAP